MRFHERQDCFRMSLACRAAPPIRQLLEPLINCVIYPQGDFAKFIKRPIGDLHIGPVMLRLQPA